MWTWLIAFIDHGTGGASSYTQDECSEARFGCGITLVSIIHQMPTIKYVQQDFPGMASFISGSRRNPGHILHKYTVIILLHSAVQDTCPEGRLFI